MTIMLTEMTDAWIFPRALQHLHGGDIWGRDYAEKSPTPDLVAHGAGAGTWTGQLGDLEPKLEQFTVDSWRSPQRIGNARLVDQFSDFGW